MPESPVRNPSRDAGCQTAQQYFFYCAFNAPAHGGESLSQEHPHHHTIPKDRVGNIVDAIYAFSMTLLVTTISVPPKYSQIVSEHPVHSVVVSVLPDLAHYFIAFIMLATFWYFEHQRFRHLRYLDRPLLILNIAGLAFVCLIPFTTNIAGDFPFDRLGAILFELNILVIGMLAFIQWIYIRDRRSGFMPELDSPVILREIRWSLVMPGLSVAGILFALLAIPWSTAIYLLAPLIMAGLYWNDPVRTTGKSGG